MLLELFTGGGKSGTSVNRFGDVLHKVDAFNRKLFLPHKNIQMAILLYSRIWYELVCTRLGQYNRSLKIEIMNALLGKKTFSYSTKSPFSSIRFVQRSMFGNRK